MKNLLVVELILLILISTGCGKQIEVPTVNAPNDGTAATPASANNPLVPSSKPDTGTGTDSGITPPDTSVHLTYYQKTKTVAPNPSFPTKTYTATGYCTLYEGKTYCWDDGKKTVVILGFSFYYSYFNMSKDVVGYSHSNGGMQDDLMVSPTVLGAGSGLAINMAAGDVDDLLNNGTATTAICTQDENDNLVCGAFSIDVNQVQL